LVVFDLIFIINPWACLPVCQPWWQSRYYFSGVCPCVCLSVQKLEKLLIRNWC